MEATMSTTQRVGAQQTSKQRFDLGQISKIQRKKFDDLLSFDLDTDEQPIAKQDRYLITQVLMGHDRIDEVEKEEYDESESDRVSENEYNTD